MSAADLAFVQRARLEALPPPLAMRGAWGWLRANLLSSGFNVGLPLVMLALIVRIGQSTIEFLLVDAVWSGAQAAMPVQAKMPRFSCAYQGRGPASIAAPVRTVIVRRPTRQVVGRSVVDATV